MSPDEARTHLRDVDAVEQTAARWRPATWAVAVFAVAFGTSVGALLAEHYWVLLGALAALALIHVLLRNRLFRPGVRTRNDLIGTDRQWWKRNSLTVWAFVAGAVFQGASIHPVLVGVLTLLATAHAWYCAAVVWPEGSRA
ncbi:hypothetical protein [Actinomyces ruminis]|uniref:DUF4395 domain-containing protein n=1 Tax=Actinomyces ruminis TaxID=1937003 RepID=A0ABX4MA50_9ACTO|nr:hypothetical protein [Actinomyces ruminis]PHP52296.1 hypothetical protein BW737_010025 [Actinomyces ruminis]